MGFRADAKGSLGVLAALCLGLVGCRDLPEYITVPGLPYAFPRGDVDRMVRPDQGMLYIRLHETPSHYILILDARNDRAERQRGHPVVSSLNFGRYAKTESV